MIVTQIEGFAFKGVLCCDLHMLEHLLPLGSPAVSRNPSQKPMELSIVDESEVRKSPLPPSTVMATADSQFEEPSKENMLEEDALPVSGIEPAAGGSQASLGSIEDGPAMQETEMGEETVKVRFSN